jgi:hypothetical protein
MARVVGSRTRRRRWRLKASVTDGRPVKPQSSPGDEVGPELGDIKPVIFLPREDGERLRRRNNLDKSPEQELCGGSLTWPLFRIW